MTNRLAGVCSLALVLAAPPAAAQTPPRCDGASIAVYEAGCDGPGRLTCDHGASLPALSTWCACDGRTVQSPSMAAPTGVRYRHRGACEVAARFELTPERGADARPTGRVVVFVAVGEVTLELSRPRGPCRDEPPGAGELGRIACGPGATVRLTLRREGDAVVGAEGARARLRFDVPAAQRVTAGPTRRF